MGCSKGHEWQATPNNIKQGKWCPQCRNVKKLTIEEMKEITKDRGGECLFEKYINIETKLKWKCSKGHMWEEAPHKIRGSKWCVMCSLTK